MFDANSYNYATHVILPRSLQSSLTFQVHSFQLLDCSERSYAITLQQNEGGKWNDYQQITQEVTSSITELTLENLHACTGYSFRLKISFQPASWTSAKSSNVDVTTRAQGIYVLIYSSCHSSTSLS